MYPLIVECYEVFSLRRQTGVGQLWGVILVTPHILVTGMSRTVHMLCTARSATLSAASAILVWSHHPVPARDFRRSETFFEAVFEPCAVS